jgi:ABC-type Fe3+/spermidine/putrescine transport system ATPase subunit
MERARVADPILRLDGVRKRFGNTAAVDGVSLDVAPGEFLTLLGPSGCGKTTTLNLVAGFEQPDGGHILLGGRAVDRLPPFKRDIGLVFQDYALFPHMTVAENVAFGLRMRRVTEAERARRVADALTQVRLPGLGDRRPTALSGGQRQRVALARALVIRPSVLLLDEPLSNLDLKLREEMRLEIMALQRGLGITTVLVTHDQGEALAVSDRIAVMNAGRVEQVGTPAEVYERPATRFVAAFMGTTNFIAGHAETPAAPGALCRVATAGGPVLAIAPGAIAAGTPVVVAVRPERLHPGTAFDGLNIAGHVRQRVYLGNKVELHVTVGDGACIVEIGSDGRQAVPEIGEAVTLAARAEDCRVFPV